MYFYYCYVMYIFKFYFLQLLADILMIRHLPFIIIICNIILLLLQLLWWMIIYHL